MNEVNIVYYPEAAEMSGGGGGGQSSRDAEIEVLKEKLAIAIQTMQEARLVLNTIEFQLYNGVYTLKKDEFETTFFARDILDLALAKIRGEK